VDVSPAQKDLAGRHAHHLPVGKEGLETRQDCPVVRVIEIGHHHTAVDQVAADVRCCQPIACAVGQCPFDGINPLALFLADGDWPGLVDELDLKAAVPGVGSRAQSFVGLARDLALRVGAIVGPAQVRIAAWIALNGGLPKGGQGMGRWKK
jgi:hypothetical protein